MSGKQHATSKIADIIKDGGPVPYLPLLSSSFHTLLFSCLLPLVSSFQNKTDLAVGGSPGGDSASLELSCCGETSCDSQNEECACFSGRYSGRVVDVEPNIKTLFKGPGQSHGQVR